MIRARGAVGSAPPWHGGGQEFKSPRVHSIILKNRFQKRFFILMGWRLLDEIRTHFKKIRLRIFNSNPTFPLA